MSPLELLLTVLMVWLVGGLLCWIGVERRYHRQRLDARREELARSQWEGRPPGWPHK